MEHRNDNLLEDDHTDAALRRLIEVAPAPTGVSSVDLVARTLHRLPTVPPAVVAQSQRDLARRNRLLRRITVALILFVAVFNIWSVAGHGPQMAFALGDGQSGLSSVLLGLQLAAKPLWYSIRALNPAVIGGAIIIAGISIWLARRLVQRGQAEWEGE